MRRETQLGQQLTSIDCESPRDEITRGRPSESHQSSAAEDCRPREAAVQRGRRSNSRKGERYDASGEDRPHGARLVPQDVLQQVVRDERAGRTQRDHQGRHRAHQAAGQAGQPNHAVQHRASDLQVERHRRPDNRQVATPRLRHPCQVSRRAWQQDDEQQIALLLL